MTMCTNCRERKSRARGLCDRCYKAARKVAMAQGQWTPPTLVDGTPAARHLDRLEAAGVSRYQVVRLSGLHPATVYGLQPGRQIAQDTARRILGVPLPHAAHTVLPDKAFMPAFGTSRRLQALCALGWPIQQLADRLGGVHPGHLAEICRGDRQLVMAYTARAVAQLYDKLQGTPGPSQRVRVVARKRGWAPPLAWAVETGLPAWCERCLDEDNHIDDPQARPSYMREGKVPFMDRYQDALEVGCRDDVEIAARLGITERSLGRQLAPSRHGRTA